MTVPRPAFIPGSAILGETSASGRLYPASVPPFAGEPLPHDFQIVTAGDCFGRGLIARRAFAVGELVFRFTGYFSPVVTQFTLTIGPGQHIDDPFVMGKVLHACEPNMSCDMRQFAYHAMRPIASGDYCTMDYEQTESQLFRGFQCHCGSPICRGWIGPRL